MANYGSDTVSVVDTNTNTVTTTIPVDKGPVYVTVTPHRTCAFVTNFTAGSVSVIDTKTNTVVKTLTGGDKIGEHPYGMAV
ncbi:YncE family protein [Streptomyces sp. NBC_01264]|uniref:YncE family protein n=1 Tax=Streptomyces sp. NBC_01264 TaxID=2903804 RepID=UPI00224F13C5|nr:hypothetical protein [Streptomyces sp. NBC_01264]MCX4784411.1 hypothetical protein [Streptomyces sp. NBC_01264]